MGQDAMKGSRKKLKILFCVSRGSVVCTCYWYYERQLKTVYLHCVFDQTTGSRQKFFSKQNLGMNNQTVAKGKQTES